MIPSAQRSLGCLLALALVAALPSQEGPTPPPNPSKLHRAVSASPLVVIGRHAGVATHGEGIRLHRVQVVETIKGVRGAPEIAALTVVDFPGASFHNRPVPQQTRLFCLVDASAAAAQSGLPEDRGPYFKLSGYAGSNPQVIGDPDASAEVRLARILGDGISERPLQDSCDQLIELIRGEDADIRIQAVAVLTGNRSLRGKIASVTWSQLVARAIAETRDVPFKIALAELCCVGEVPGVVENLCLSVPVVEDREFALFLGRAARMTMREQGTDLLRSQVRQARTERVRARFLLALGATQSQGALDTLLELRDKDPEDRGVRAALEIHGSRAAREATARRRDR